MAVPKTHRISKLIARAGLCSRREAEKWINDGRVKLDGKVLSTPAVNVTNENDILVDNTPLPKRQPIRVWRYHKPKGVLTTRSDPKNRATVFDQFPKDLQNLISVGRLDMNTEGLLLMTNDGEIARHLELPANGWSRRYRARVYGKVEQSQLDKLKFGVVIEGARFGAVEAILDRQKSANAWITLSLSEGKNREVRKIMEYMGWSVTRLIRISYGPFQLGKLPKNALDEVKTKTLKEQLGGIISKPNDT